MSASVEFALNSRGEQEALHFNDCGTPIRVAEDTQDNLDGSMRRSSSQNAYKPLVVSPIRGSRSSSGGSASVGFPQACLSGPDSMAAPSASSSTGKRRCNRNSSSPGSATGVNAAEARPIVSIVEDGPRSSSGVLLKRSCTTPSLRVPGVPHRSKSHDKPGKAKTATRHERQESRTLEDGASVDDGENSRSAKTSPSQAFRVLPSRLSAPPTPRRLTPHQPKRTPRLSPRTSLPGHARLHFSKDVEEGRRLQAWERDGWSARKRQQPGSCIEADSLSTPPVPTGVSSTASPSSRFDASGSMASSCDTTAIEVMELHPPCERSALYCISGATTPTEGDASCGRCKMQANSTMDSRIMKLIGRRSVLSNGTLTVDLPVRRRERQRQSHIPSSSRASRGGNSITPEAARSPPLGEANGVAAKSSQHLKRRNLCKEIDNDETENVASDDVNYATEATRSTSYSSTGAPTAGHYGVGVNGAGSELHGFHDHHGHGASAIVGISSPAPGLDLSFGTVLPVPEDKDETPFSQITVQSSPHGRTGTPRSQQEEDEDCTSSPSQVGQEAPSRGSPEHAEQQEDLAQQLDEQPPRQQSDVKLEQQMEPDTAEVIPIQAISGELQSSALIWPGRAAAHACASEVDQRATQVVHEQQQQPQQTHANAQQPPQHPHASAAWSWPQPQPAQHFTEVVADPPLFDPSTVTLVNEVGSVMNPHTWRYVSRPENATQNLPSSPSTQVESPRNHDAWVAASEIELEQPCCSAASAANAEAEPAVDRPMDLDEKRGLVMDLVQHLSARNRATEGAVSKAQRESRALQITLEVSQRNNQRLQQQLAYVAHTWQYVQNANICYQVAEEDGRLTTGNEDETSVSRAPGMAAAHPGETPGMHADDLGV